MLSGFATEEKNTWWAENPPKPEKTRVLLNLPGYHEFELLHQGAEHLILSALRVPDGSRVLLKTTVTDTPSLEQFTRWRKEYDNLQALQGTAAPGILDCPVVENRPILVLECIEGSPLEELETPDTGEFLKLSILLVDALDTVHLRGFVHQRIAPDSFLVSLDLKRTRLINFDQACRSPGTSRIRLAGQAYMAPEQTGRIEKPIDFRADLYSLGAVFYRLLTGRPPFLAEDQAALIHAHIARIPEPPHLLNSNVLPMLSEVVLKLLAKSESDRYQSCAGLRSDLVICLEQWERDRSIPVFPPGRLDVSYRLDIPDRLYGRDSQLKSLLGAFESVRQGGVAWVQLRGNSGVGKSTLAEAARKKIINRGGFFVTGKFQPYHQNRPYHALLESFEELALLLLSETEYGLNAWKKRILEAVSPNG
ncbi:MAG: serine/threonine-protein kinase PknK, partial [Candidatus Eremiobacteraeota bacterium]|nr:serine/threonine-protein kinase PknK [Candidatus Eremiobacteraeota bacterium]